MQTLSHPTPLSHARALWAIMWKDWKHFWRYPLNVASYIFQPLVWLVPVYFMGQVFSVDGEARGFAGYSGSGDYMSFILLGTALNNFIFAVFWGMGYALKNDMDTGVLEANWLLPIPRLLLLVGHTFTNLITTALTSAAARNAAHAGRGRRPPHPARSPQSVGRDCHRVGAARHRPV